MSYVIKSRQTNLSVANVSTAEEALIAEAAGFRADGVGYQSILELAELRVKESPDYNQLPNKEDRYVRYTTKAGKMIICEVVRLTAPDEEGYPQLVELINLARPDGSFMAQASNCKPIDLSSMSPALANALLQGTQMYDLYGGGDSPKLTKGIRKDGKNGDGKK